MQEKILLSDDIDTDCFQPEQVHAITQKTLQSIANVCEVSPDTADTFIIAMSNYIRSMLDIDARHTKREITAEIRLLKSYLILLQNDNPNLGFSLHLPDMIPHIFIKYLSLISFLYNILPSVLSSSSDRYLALIHISLHKKDDNWLLSVGDWSLLLQNHTEGEFFSDQSDSTDIIHSNIPYEHIRPHFLFNVINLIDGYCYADTAKAGALTRILSEFLDCLFCYDNETDTASLSDEIKITKLYALLEEERFSNLTVEFLLPDSIPDVSVPKYILYDAVDIAIRKGVRISFDAGVVTVSLTETTDNHFSLHVSDTGKDTKDFLFMIEN